MPAQAYASPLPPPLETFFSLPDFVSAYNNPSLNKEGKK